MTTAEIEHIRKAPDHPRSRIGLVFIGVLIVHLAIGLAISGSLLLKRQPALPDEDMAAIPSEPAEPQSPADPLPTTDAANTYTVKSGDSYWSIARQHNLTIQELLRYNELTEGNVLRPNQVLRIPPR